MKKSGYNLDVGHVKSEKIGVLLSTSLNKMQNENCVSLEEIAALVDGNIANAEKDRIMGHLASCHNCYQVFLLTSDLKEEKIIPIKRPFFSHPMRLAASIIVAVFSLFLFYKIVFVPGVSDKLESKAGPAVEAPVPILKEGVELERRDKRPVKKEVEKEEPTLHLKEEKSEKKPEIPPQPAAFKVGLSASTPKDEKKGDAGAKKKLQARQAQSDRDAGKQREQQTIAEEFQYTRTKKDNRKQRNAVPEKIALSERKNPAKKSGTTTERLNRELSNYRAYIPGEEIGDFFRKTVVLARKLRYENLEQAAGDVESDEFGDRAAPVRELAPAMSIEAGESAGLIIPNIRYFYEKSEPGTREYKFFSLALSGYCDGYGCYGKVAGKIEDGEKEKLLKSWQELKPELTGIYFKIAVRTISRLSK